MEPNVNQERLQAHALLDMLPPEKLNAVRSLLEVLVEPASPEPLSHSLAKAPFEDEELTPATAAALDASRASLERGGGIPHEEILREFGLG
jgi:hypothetical protein